MSSSVTQKHSTRLDFVLTFHSFSRLVGAMFSFSPHKSRKQIKDSYNVAVNSVNNMEFM